MFFGKSAQLQHAETRIDYLSKTIDELNAQIKQMREDADKEKESDLQTSTFALDFNIMRVFAIERNIHNGDVCTIVGHFISEPVAFTDGNVAAKEVTREWYMYCSQEQHENLVKEFEAYKKVNK